MSKHRQDFKAFLNWIFKMEKYIASLKTTKAFPDYNKFEMQQEIDEIDRIYLSMTDKLKDLSDDQLGDDSQVSDEGQSIRTSILIDNMKIERIKRWLYAFHNERINRLQKYFWINGKDLPDHIKQSLSREEIEYFK